MNDAARIKGKADAVNITDNQRAVMRMSPLAVCALLQSKGYETILHVTCRDRNRLALQSDILGASAMGIANILVMSGDHPTKGDHGGAKPVYDLDSVQLLEAIHRLNRGFDLAGNILEGKTDFCAGAVTGTGVNEPSLIKLEKKIRVGARFLQTQAVFDVEQFSDFMRAVKSMKQKHQSEMKVIAGIIPLRSEKSARFLNSRVAGIKVPEEIIGRMQTASDPEAEGMEIAAELMHELKRLCDGIHIMPLGSHENTGKLLEIAGIGR